MNLLSAFRRTAWLGIGTAACSFFATPSCYGTPPDWWDDVTDTSATVNDWRAASIGQAKNFALHAMQHLDEALEEFDLPDGGAGREIHDMIASWRVDPSDDESDWKVHDVNRVINQGQLKALVKPFYDRLAQLGLWDRGWSAWPLSSPLPPFDDAPYDGPTWWLPTPANPAEWTHLPRYPWKFWKPSNTWMDEGKTQLSMLAANVGQLKHCFNFDAAQQLTLRTYLINGNPVTYLTSGVPTDSDSDGVADLVERLLGTDLETADISASAFELLLEDGFSHSTLDLSPAAASRLLAQATWGPTWETIDEVLNIGIEDWIDQQIEDDPFRESGQMMAYEWLDESGTLPWQNLWYEWSDQSQAPSANLYVNSASSYSQPDSFWPNHDDPEWRMANDEKERGPYQNASFPKRGIEPYMYYLHWRKLVLDRPLWQPLLPGGPGPHDYVSTTLPFPYHISGRISDNAFLTANADSSGMDDAWIRRALFDSDQLRQRVAWALSQILVVSDVNGFSSEVAGAGSSAAANYYDLLTHHSFGNYRELLTAVTFHPLMASWLSYRDNTGDFPDENYAREIMQLFSIGLRQLNLDGTPKLDAEGREIPTYTQDDIHQLARVFTGLQYRTSAHPCICLPLKMNATLHDKRSKSFLGMVIEANTEATAAECEAEVRDAVGHIATRPEVAPFISRQLIAHLVTSTPSHGYVRRIASVFHDNEEASDQLGKVVKAILMDPEARAADTYLFNPGAGRLKDPMLRLLSLMRAFNAGRDFNHGVYDLRDSNQNPLDGPIWGWNHFVERNSEPNHPYQDFLQYPFVPPSVFSFFLPNYTQSGMIANSRMTSPEFQLLSPATAASSAARVWHDTQAPSVGGLVRTGFNSYRIHQWQQDWMTALYEDPTIKPEGTTLEPDGSGLDLAGKALRLHFDSLAASGGLPAVLGTEIDMSPRPSGSAPTPPSSGVAGDFLDQLDILLCHGRMTPSTRAELLTLLTDPSDSDYMHADDGWRWERTAVQILWALPECAVLR